MHQINYSMLTEKGKRNLSQQVISLWNLYGKRVIIDGDMQQIKQLL